LADEIVYKEHVPMRSGAVKESRKSEPGIAIGTRVAGRVDLDDGGIDGKVEFTGEPLGESYRDGWSLRRGFRRHGPARAAAFCLLRALLLAPPFLP
jgi:hypothetical protein